MAHSPPAGVRQLDNKTKIGGAHGARYTAVSLKSGAILNNVNVGALAIAKFPTSEHIFHSFLHQFQTNLLSSNSHHHQEEHINQLAHSTMSSLAENLKELLASVEGKDNELVEAESQNQKLRAELAEAKGVADEAKNQSQKLQADLAEAKRVTDYWKNQSMSNLIVVEYWKKQAKLGRMPESEEEIEKVSNWKKFAASGKKDDPAKEIKPTLDLKNDREDGDQRKEFTEEHKKEDERNDEPINKSQAESSEIMTSEDEEEVDPDKTSRDEEEVDPVRQIQAIWKNRSDEDERVSPDTSEDEEEVDPISQIKEILKKRRNQDERVSPETSEDEDEVDPISQIKELLKRRRSQDERASLETSEDEEEFDPVRQIEEMLAKEDRRNEDIRDFPMSSEDEEGVHPVRQSKTTAEECPSEDEEDSPAALEDDDDEDAVRQIKEVTEKRRNEDEWNSPATSEDEEEVDPVMEILEKSRRQEDEWDTPATSEDDEEVNPVRQIKEILESSRHDHERGSPVTEIEILADLKNYSNEENFDPIIEASANPQARVKQIESFTGQSKSSNGRQRSAPFQPIEYATESESDDNFDAPPNLHRSSAPKARRGNFLVASASSDDGSYETDEDVLVSSDSSEDGGSSARLSSAASYDSNGKHSNDSRLSRRDKRINVDIFRLQRCDSDDTTSTAMSDIFEGIETTISSSLEPESAIDELKESIGELYGLPKSLPGILKMMDNILKTDMYYRVLWLDATCDTTHREGHWTLLRLQSMKMEGHLSVLWHDKEWVPRTKECLKVFVPVLVELCDEFESLCKEAQRFDKYEMLS